MTSAGFALLLLAYALACYGGIRGYCSVAVKIYKQTQQPPVQRLLTNVWFLAFVVIEIPFAIFFPAWLAEKLSIFAPGSFSTGGLILLGAATLAAATWKGFRSDEARQMLALLRQPRV
jgi:hypothetical protein